MTKKGFYDNDTENKVCPRTPCALEVNGLLPVIGPPGVRSEEQ
jgi:hypothetical protein